MSATVEVRVMAARFASTCGACGAGIRKGADIRYVKGLPANHETCGDPAGEPVVRMARRTRNRVPMSSYGRVTAFNRCTHEDYPCCGCDS